MVDGFIDWGGGCFRGCGYVDHCKNEIEKHCGCVVDLEWRIEGIKASEVAVEFTQDAD